MRALIVAIACLLNTVVSAATAVAHLYWVAPTLYTNGQPIAPAAITYSIYRISATGPLKPYTGITRTDYEVPGGDCYYVEAVVGGVSSAGTAIVCQTT
jgi:hypothetical protein